MITGKSVRLRAIEKNDLPRFVAWLNEPEVRRNLVVFQPLSSVQEEKWFEEILKRPVEEQPLSMDVLDKDIWRHAGNISFFDLDQRSRSAEIGIFIGEKTLWDKGFGSEAMRLMIAHGFETLNLNRIYLRVFETNPRGMRCYEKAGFRQEGRMRQAYYLEGRYIDVLIMSILKEDYLEEKNGDN